MYFSKLPEGFPGTGSDIVVSLAGCDPEKITEVRIIKDGEILGVKRFRGETAYNVNASCYLRGTVEPEPLMPVRLGFTEQSSRLRQFSVTATAYTPEEDGPATEALWIETGSISYTAAAGNTPWKTNLTEIDDHYEISTGETLEIPFISELTRMSAIITIRSPRYSHSIYPTFSGQKGNNMFTFLFNPSMLEKETEEPVDETMDLEITVKNMETNENSFSFTKRIIVRDKCPDAVRLCWVNRFGAIDYYTFSPVRAEALSVEKNRIKTARGSEVSHVESERTVTVQTPYSTPAYIAQLAGIVSSPKVWRMADGEAVPVDITSERVELGHDGLQKMVLCFRES